MATLFDSATQLWPLLSTQQHSYSYSFGLTSKADVDVEDVFPALKNTQGGRVLWWSSHLISDSLRTTVSATSLLTGIGWMLKRSRCGRGSSLLFFLSAFAATHTSPSDECCRLFQLFSLGRQRGCSGATPRGWRSTWKRRQRCSRMSYAVWVTEGHGMSCGLKGSQFTWLVSARVSQRGGHGVTILAECGRLILGSLLCPLIWRGKKKQGGGGGWIWSLVWGRKACQNGLNLVPWLETKSMSEKRSESGPLVEDEKHVLKTDWIWSLGWGRKACLKNGLNLVPWLRTKSMS